MRHDTQHNDIYHNDPLHNDIHQYDTQHNDNQHNGRMLSVTNKPFMLNVVSVMAPNVQYSRFFTKTSSTGNPFLNGNAHKS